MIFRQLFDGESSTYTYLVADESTKDAVLIDAVFERHPRDLSLVRELGLRLRYTLDTHVHADHVTGAWLMKQALGSEIVYAKMSGAECADRYVEHGDVIEFGTRGLQVLATPGHTAGCVSFLTLDRAMVFTGDCLLIRGCGRTDFQQGSATQMFRSIRERLFSLPDECVVYPGHDYAGRTSSTIGEEQVHNPRIGGAADEGDFVGYLESMRLPHPKRIDVAVPANLVCGRVEEDHLPEAGKWGPVTLTYAGVPTIDAEWVYRNLDRLHLLDVRQPEELRGELGYVEGSQHIPIRELEGRAKDVPRDKPVVALCRSGRRSAQAVALLQKAGVARVANLDGGMLRWRELSLPARHT